MENKRERPTREVLFDLYVTQHLTQREVASLYGVTQTTMSKWLREAGVPARSRVTPKDPPRSELWDLYVAKEWSMKKIGRHYGVTATCVLRWLRRAEIQTRTSAEAGHIAMGKKRPDGATLRRMYLEEKMSYKQIADHFGVSNASAYAWMRSEGIEMRTPGEGISLATKGKPWSEKQRASQAIVRTTPEYRQMQSEIRRGEKSHLWRGGKIQGETLRLQGWEWRSRRKECYARDNWLCQDCGVHCTSRGKTKIQAHHIVSRRDGGSDALSNLVTLCISCHHKREWAERNQRS